MKEYVKENTFKFVSTYEIIFLARCRSPMDAIISNSKILQ